MVCNGCSIQKIRMQRTVMGMIVKEYHVLYLVMKPRVKEPHYTRLKKKTQGGS